MKLIDEHRTTLARGGERDRARRVGKQFENFKLSPMTATIGAEIDGIRIGALDKSTLDELKSAWIDWKVLVFRDQDVSVEDHVNFSRQFSGLEEHPFTPHIPDHPEVIVLESTPGAPEAAEVFHSDLTYLQCPPMGSILRGRIIPSFGGDTIWSDMEAAYDGLEESLRQFLDDRRAIHTVTKNVLNLKSKAAKAEELRRKFPDRSQPIVRVHPVSGRLSLYVNESFTSHIEGMDAMDSQELLRFLYRQALIPLYQVRVRWRPNTFVMWDNRSTQHYVVPDFFSNHRRMERTTLVGDEPAPSLPS